MASTMKHSDRLESVLDEIAQRTRCAYLSDLRNILAPGCCAVPEGLSSAILATAEGAHTAMEWELAAQYLLGKTQHFSAAEDAVAALLASFPDEITTSLSQSESENIYQREKRSEE